MIKKWKTFIIQYYFTSLFQWLVVGDKCTKKNPVSRMPPTGFYGYLIENT